MNTTYFEDYFGSIQKSTVSFYCRGTTPLPRGQGKKRFGSLLTGGSSTISCKPKTQRIILLEKLWGGRRINCMLRCMQGDKTPGQINPYFQISLSKQSEKEWGNRECSSCFVNVEGTDSSPADKQSSVWHTSRSNCCLWLWSSCPEGIPQPAFGKAISLNPVMQQGITYQHAMEREVSVDFELICPCDPFARVQ